jgi:spermidine/putrescine transport system ATP-binding protein
MLELVTIFKAFGRESVLRDISLTVAKGEFLSVLGPSGCGKSTLLRILAGFETPDQGRLLWDSKDITRIPPNRRPFNMVFQRYALFPHLSVEENIGFGPRVRGESSAVVSQKVRDVLELVRLENLGERRVETLSGGQQQRVALARAIINNPQVLLLDEPMSALDRSLREKMRLDILNIQRRLGITFIMVTHDQEEAMAMSDRIAIMNQGAIEQVGSPEVIYKSPKTRFVGEAIGTLNMIELGRGVFYVRPEHLKLLKRPPLDQRDADRILPVIIREILFRGAITQYAMECSGGPMAKALVTSVIYGESEEMRGAMVDDQLFVTWDQSSEIHLADSAKGTSK